MKLNQSSQTMQGHHIALRLMWRKFSLPSNWDYTDNPAEVMLHAVF